MFFAQVELYIINFENLNLLIFYENYQQQSERPMKNFSVAESLWSILIIIMKRNLHKIIITPTKPSTWKLFFCIICRCFWRLWQHNYAKSFARALAEIIWKFIKFKVFHDFFKMINLLFSRGYRNYVLWSENSNKTFSNIVSSLLTTFIHIAIISIFFTSTLKSWIFQLKIKKMSHIPTTEPQE